MTRGDVDSLVRAVLAAAEPGACVRGHGAEFAGTGPVVLLAVGKASRAMAMAAAGLAGKRVRGGLVVAPGAPDGIASAAVGAPLGELLRVFEADHPLPRARNERASRAVVELVQGLGAEDTLVFLLSGGASALMTLPVQGVPLDELRAVSDALMKAGAPIDELNCVRKHCEQLKGGGLARLAAPRCRAIVSLTLSDVVGDDVGVIGSGPMSPDATRYADALRVLEARGVIDLAPRIAAHLRRGAAGEAPETVKPGDACLRRVRNIIVGSNVMAVDAAAVELGRMGFDVVEKRARVEGEASEVGRALAERVRSIAEAPVAGPRAIVWGGETTVTVGQGSGVGGRNQELALAAAVALEGVPNAGVMSLATDGVDGPTDAAGAVVDGGTVGRARTAGLEPAEFLHRHDSHTFFSRLDGGSGLIRTGPSGTNVNDVMVGWVG